MNGLLPQAVAPNRFLLGGISIRPPFHVDVVVAALFVFVFQQVADLRFDCRHGFQTSNDCLCIHVEPGKAQPHFQATALEERRQRLNVGRPIKGSRQLVVAAVAVVSLYHLSVHVSLFCDKAAAPSQSPITHSLFDDSANEVKAGQVLRTVGCIIHELFLFTFLQLLNFSMDVIAIALAALGFISIVGSIFIWNIKKGETAEEKAHAERFGIFIGLWAPTFFALAVLAKVM